MGAGWGGRCLFCFTWRGLLLGIVQRRRVRVKVHYRDHGVKYLTLCIEPTGLYHHTLGEFYVSPRHVGNI